MGVCLRACMVVWLYTCMLVWLCDCILYDYIEDKGIVGIMVVPSQAPRVIRG